MSITLVYYERNSHNKSQNSSMLLFPIRIRNRIIFCLRSQSVRNNQNPTSCNLFNEFLGLHILIFLDLKLAGLAKLNCCLFLFCTHLSRIMRNPAFFICENKDADQLHGNREADQHLCFCYIDSTIFLLSKSKISSI